MRPRESVEDGVRRRGRGGRDLAKSILSTDRFSIFKPLSLRDSIGIIASCHGDRDMSDRHSWGCTNDGVPLVEAQIYLYSRDDEMELVLNREDGGHPEFAIAHGLVTYLEAATLAFVLSVKKRQQPPLQLEDYAAALEQYAEQDALLARGGVLSRWRRAGAIARNYA